MLYVHLHNPSIDSALRTVFTSNQVVYTRYADYIGQIMIDGKEFKTMVATGSISEVFDTLTKAVNHLVTHEGWEFAKEPMSEWTRCPKCNALMPKSGCGACITERSILRGKIEGVLLLEIDYEPETIGFIVDKIMEAIDDTSD